jgi:DNA processing protein
MSPNLGLELAYNLRYGDIHVEDTDLMESTQLAALRSVFKLVRTPGLGARKIKQLCDHFGTAEQVLKADSKSLAELPGFGKSVVSALEKTRADATVDTWIDAELERATRLQITIMGYGHPDYPVSLANIYDPPPVLYVRGVLPATVQGGLEHLRSLAIVGTRDPSDYGLKISRDFASDLAQIGVTVLSGLALGVDGAAHQGVLDALRKSSAAAPTVAVLGSGVDVLYPYKHTRLAQDIIATGGAILSEYAIGTKPNARNFPGRNRIINGLSAGTLVVEAGAKSGALITADYASEEGRTVLAVPGRAGDNNAAGTLGLLKQGAVLVTSVQDILDEFGWQPQQVQQTVQAGQTPASGTANLLEADTTARLSADEQALLQLIHTLEAPLLDDLIVASGKPAQDILVTLTMLELAGAVQLAPTGRYKALKGS